VRPVKDANLAVVGMRHLKKGSAVRRCDRALAASVGRRPGRRKKEKRAGKQNVDLFPERRCPVSSVSSVRVVVCACVCREYGVKEGKALQRAEYR
jgi:hypothetical protein